MQFVYLIHGIFFFQFQTFEVVKIIVDPRYDAGHYKYDGCILKTSEPLTSAYGYVWPQLFTSLKADLRQDINGGFALSRCLDGTFP